jgi:biotin carboxyl carrier protein
MKKEEYNLKIQGTDYNVVVDQTKDDLITVEVNGTPYVVEIDRPVKAAPVKVVAPVAASSQPVSAPVIAKPAASASSIGTAVKSPLPGVVLSVDVNIGDKVRNGQRVLLLEAMKMENSIEATRDGKIAAIKVAKGDSVLEGAELIIIE